jgi:hypothetical protein
VAANPSEIDGSVVSDNLDLGERNPLFTGEAAGDLSLQAESPVFKESPRFQPIPFAKIGLRVDEFRPTLPPRQWENAPQQWSPH